MLLRDTNDKGKTRETDKKIEQEMKESENMSTRSSQRRTEKDAFSGKVMKTIIIFWVITIPIALFFAWGFSKMLMKIGR